jgi:hypothetical protein
MRIHNTDSNITGMVRMVGGSVDTVPFSQVDISLHALAQLMHVAQVKHCLRQEII